MRRLAALTLVLTVALAGCGDRDDPPPAPPPSPSPTGTPTPSAAPVMPDEAKRDTKAGAVAFVKYYVAAFNHAQATGDVSALERLGAPSCESCAAVVKAIRKVYEAGGHSEGGEMVISGAVVNPSAGGNWQVDIAGRFKPSRNYASMGASPTSISGADAVSTFIVRFKDSWRVLEWARV